jgi:predicted RNase H-like HicB family nuclease
MVTKKDLKYYLGLMWSYTVEQDEHNGKKFFIIRVNELPGVVSDGATMKEAEANVQEAIAAAIELYLDQGDTIPEPISKDKFKGNISYRTSSERHYNLAKIAGRLHLSMNKALDMVVDAGLKSVKH